MINPNNSRMYSGAGTITPENPLNSPSVSNSQGYNTFDLSNAQYHSLRFGELTPFHVTPVEIGDRKNLQNKYNLIAPTFQSPLMSEVRFNRDYFLVPKSAMMPNTWEYLFVNPNQGDDVPDDAFPVLDLKEFISTIWYQLNRLATKTDADTQNSFSFMLNLLYKWFGFGSLLDCLGYREHIFLPREDFSIQGIQADLFDNCIDSMISWLQQTDELYPQKQIRQYEITSESGAITLAGTPYRILKPESASLSDIRRFFYEYFNSDKLYVLRFEYIKDGEGTKLIPLNRLIGTSGLQSLYTIYNQYSSSSSQFFKPYNLYRLIAYHLACVQFFSDDVVDNISTGKLWMQNMESLERLVSMTDDSAYTSPSYFDRNGVEIRYDVFSKHNLDILIAKIKSYTTINIVPDMNYVYAMQFFINLGEFHYAKRYGDYFCGSRTRPLAVGDVDISVGSSNLVSAIDITKGITMQRFLNAVNRVGQLVADYARNIFGVAPKNLPPQARFINHESKVIRGDTVVNTAENQGNRKTNMSGNGSNFAYDVFVDEPGIIIGIASVTSLPAYRHTTARDIYHQTRLDDFQPFLQNIGDQEVYQQELIGINDLYDGDYNSGLTPFGYQLQDAEYKFGVSEAHGAFVNLLPSWLFTYPHYNKQISSEFLRLYPWMFDRFMSQNTGFSTASYYHFLVQFVNSDTSNRRMMYRPSIL